MIVLEGKRFLRALLRIWGERSSIWPWDLHAYATAGGTDDMQFGIVFRVIEARERDGINRKIHDLRGVKEFAHTGTLSLQS